MNVILLCPAPFGRFSLGFSKKQARQTFHTLAQQDPGKRLIVADSIPSRLSNRVRLTSVEHYALFLPEGHRRKGVPGAEEILRSLIGTLGGNPGAWILTTWGEYPSLRQAAARLGLRMVSLAPAAPGSRLLNRLRLDALGRPLSPLEGAEGETPASDPGTCLFPPSPPEEHLHYSRFHPLPPVLAGYWEDPATPPILVLVGKPPRGNLLRLEDLVLRVAGLLPNPRGVPGKVLVMPLEKGAFVYAKTFSAALRGETPLGSVQYLRPPRLTPDMWIALMTRSAGVISLHSMVALDALVEAPIPVAMLGARCQDFSWLLPRGPIPEDSRQRRGLGHEQRERFFAAGAGFQSRGEWVDNRIPTPEEFLGWLIRLTDHTSTSSPVFPPRYSAKPLPAFFNAWGQAGLPVGVTALQNWTGRVRRKTLKLRRDPLGFFRDAKFPLLKRRHGTFPGK
ncbi:MAG: hypothetical protein OEW39_11585 [Deltaproteobacteria bacterium]|nr:hypothetical protein [Deltaproteobacteria bacterium]